MKPQHVTSETAKPPRPPAELLRLLTRPDFLRTAAGRKCATPGLVLQARERTQTQATRIPPQAIRFGLTASKKVGNAVARNRVRRRLRALAKEILPGQGRAGFDYVLIGRGATLTRSWCALRQDLESALERVERAPKGNGGGGNGGKGPDRNKPATKPTLGPARAGSV